jgi:hypothetical protein
MNTYSKYCPNVFVAKCDKEYKKDDIISVTTKYGKENESIIHNLVYQKDGFFYYSITRADGFNSQERAKQKAERLKGWATNAEKRSLNHYESSQEGREFLRLAEPIKIGHYSEKKHRALIDRNWNRMGKSVEESKKANSYESRSEYWERLSSKIDLSMPDCLEYFEYRLEEAKAKHENLKCNPEKRLHSLSLTYAKKELNEIEKKIELAKKLWS